MRGRVFLGRYETVRLLGEGGMGQVFLARHVEKDEAAVIKVMHEHVATDARFRERFQRERDLMRRFEHPNTVAFIDASLDDPEGPCIVMEYLPGITLDKLLSRNGRFSPARIRRIVAQSCDVLQAAHEIGIIHRDLKPANLMVLEPDTPFEKLKIMDFGLAEMMGETSSKGGRPEYAVGTAGYMPPEQVRGEEMDHRGDLYSLGVILYQLLTGRLPFAGGSAMEILMEQASEGPPTFASLGLSDKVPPAVEVVVRACLASDPDQRPQSAREVGDSYEGALLYEYGQRHDPEPAPAPLPPPKKEDPNLFEGELEAWMPDQIALYKLKGFVQEVHGKILENSPGKVRVRMTAPPSSGGGMFGWLSSAGRSCSLDMDLHLDRKDPKKPTLLHVKVHMRPSRGSAPSDWKARCGRVYVALRSYLIS